MAEKKAEQQVRKKSNRSAGAKGGTIEVITKNAFVVTFPNNTIPVVNAPTELQRFYSDELDK